ncbi:MAG: hypothetical protein R3E96_15410 [Planctomycetota bacterium]
MRYQPRKFARRNRVLVAGVLGALIALHPWPRRQHAAVLEARDRGKELSKALGEVKAANTEAGESLRESEATTDFLSEILPAGTPDLDHGEVTLKELLIRSSGTIDEGFADSPRVAERLHTTVARAFEALAEFGPAEEHGRRALELAQTLANGSAPAPGVSLVGGAGATSGALR